MSVPRKKKSKLKKETSFELERDNQQEKLKQQTLDSSIDDLTRSSKSISATCLTNSAAVAAASLPQKSEKKSERV